MESVPIEIARLPTPSPEARVRAPDNVSDPTRPPEFTV